MFATIDNNKIIIACQNRRRKDTMTTYTPEDVYGYAIDGNSGRLIKALNVSDNRVNWYTDDDGCNALHVAISNEQYDCIGIYTD